MGKLKMATKLAKKSAAAQVDESEVRHAAYLIWEQQTGGSPVDDEQSRRFWLEAEQKLSNGNGNGDKPSNGN
jgi:hypothetical protein